MFEQMEALLQNYTIGELRELEEKENQEEGLEKNQEGAKHRDPAEETVIVPEICSVAAICPQ